MLIFNKDTGFSVSDVETVREQVATEWKNAFKANTQTELNTDVETPAGQIIDAQTASIVQKDAEIAYLANQFNPLTATGIWQDALAKIYFLERKKAINSYAIVRCFGRVNTVIPKDAIIQSTTDGTQWSNEQEGTIQPEGYIDLKFNCSKSGLVTASANTLTKIITTVVGLDNCTNYSSAIVGTLEETQTAFEKRRYESVALNSRSNVQAITARIQQIENVVAVFVTQNRTSENIYIDNQLIEPHSVFASVLGGNDEQIATAIYNTMSAGSGYTGNTFIGITDPYTSIVETVGFWRPTDISVYMNITIQDQELPSDYEKQIKDILINNFYGLDEDPRVVMNDDLYISRFIVSLLKNGFKNTTKLTFSFNPVDENTFLHIPINRAPVLSANHINITVVESK